MRPVAICACLYACLAASSAFAAEPTPDVTVILDFKGLSSPQAIAEMEREASQIIRASGIELGWQRRDGSTARTYNDLVVLTFRGSCMFVPAPPVYDELGPYASTRTSNGEVQPFADVDCDRVVSSAHAAMFGGDFGKADILIGRALGRVVAHELVHMLTKSDIHAKDGVQKAELSGRQLIAKSLPLAAFDVDRLRLERRLH